MIELRLISALLLLSSATVLAQQPAPEIGFPKGDLAWTVAFEAAKGTGESPAATPRDIDIVRQGDVRRDRITWSDGHASEQWWTVSPSFLLFENGPDHAVSWLKGAWARGQAYDENLFQWVDASTFVEATDYEKKRCRLYRTRIASNAGSVTCSAWIDEETRLPVAYAEGNRVALFTFSKTSLEPLSMPEKFQAAAQKVRDLDTAPKRFGQ
jgi:hypothetical protein